MIDLQNLSSDFINSLKSRDKAAFNSLVQNAHYRLLAFASSIIGAELAEDTMQDAWVSAWKGLPKFEGRSSLLTWLYTIVRNECIARLKKENRNITIPESVLGGGDTEDWLDARFNEQGSWSDPPTDWNLSTPESTLEGSQLERCLERHIDNLHPMQRSVFRLRDIEQLDFEEICNILEISHSNARVLLHRARLQLLKMIEHYQKTGDC